MDLKNIASLEEANKTARPELFRMGTALIFIIVIMLMTGLDAENVPGSIMLVVASMIGGYMALNIGANDVANNIGPAVGSQAITLTGAIALAIIFEASGALIAGGDVVGTIKKDIIDPALIGSSEEFIWMMTGALLAAAVWLNIATAVGAPVSTTHAIVGGVLGAGVASGGWDVANWPQVGAIAASWVISPLLGGLIAAGFLYFIKRSIIYQKNGIAAAKRIIPVLFALMVWAFSTYLALKGLKNIWQLSFPSAVLIGLATASMCYVILRPLLARAQMDPQNVKEGVNRLFTIPLIGAAALLSFAHGANDVANAVGPLAAINDAVSHTTIAAKAQIPIWIMLIGAIGIALGLGLYGPKLIRTVGSEITELDKTRAFCIAMAAAITVILASQLGLPVSSTHIAVGGVFGVGFLRERIKFTCAQMLDEIRHHHQGADQDVVEAFLSEFKAAAFDEKTLMLKALKQSSSVVSLSKRERKALSKFHRQKLVKRAALLKIASAWVVTVPFSALLAAMFFFTLRGMMLP